MESSAQISVYDPAITARNTATAVVKEFLLNTEREQHRQLRRMAKRLSLLTSLAKYAPERPPRWRTHGGDFLFTQAYNDALIFGDPAGAAFLSVSHPVMDARAPPGQAHPAGSPRHHLPPGDGEHDRCRGDRGDERHRAASLSTDESTNCPPSTRWRRTSSIRRDEQSATAVLDKISGAALIAARQRQARVQLLAGVVEQLLIDTKRARDADAAAMNMQLVNWRDGRAANEAFVAGSGDALRTWRQP